MDNIKILSHPAITESGIYDVLLEVDGEVVEREFEVDVDASYSYEDDTNSYNLKRLAVYASCCDEDDKDIEYIMEHKLEEEIEHYMWSM